MAQTFLTVVCTCVAFVWTCAALAWACVRFGRVRPAYAGAGGALSTLRRASAGVRAAAVPIGARPLEGRPCPVASSACAWSILGTSTRTDRSTLNRKHPTNPAEPSPRSGAVSLRRATVRTACAAAALILAAVMVQSTALAGPLSPPLGPAASTQKALAEIGLRTAVNAANTPGIEIAANNVDGPIIDRSAAAAAGPHANFTH
ncbi:MAG: hypothetical protein IBJ18_01495 [Phycisphaerales bacterium]|nr:hypothetical protein [Phycisphaerales bacterium]